MTKFTKFIFFNLFTYVFYLLIDKIFTLLNLYSNPKLGYDLMVMPTNTDMIFIGINTLLSSAGALYLIFKLKDKVY